MFSPHKQPDTVWIDDSQWIHTPLYISTYNELWITPSTHIHPDLSAAQLGLTPEDLKPILWHQQEHLLDEFAQPPPISTKPIIHPSSSAAQLGLTSEDMEEVLADQIEWMREEEEQEQRAEGHTIAEEAHQQQDHNRDNGGMQPLFPLLRHMHDTGNNTMNDNNNLVIPFEHCKESNDGAACMGHEHNNTHELAIADDGHVDWAAEMEEAMAPPTPP
jgi:hypothetical protein